MPLSEAARLKKNEYNRKYKKEHKDSRIRFYLTLYPATNAEMIEYLRTKDNIAGYLKELVLKDMKKAD